MHGRTRPGCSERQTIRRSNSTNTGRLSTCPSVLGAYCYEPGESYAGSAATVHLWATEDLRAVRYHAHRSLSKGRFSDLHRQPKPMSPTQPSGSLAISPHPPVCSPNFNLLFKSRLVSAFPPRSNPLVSNLLPFRPYQPPLDSFGHGHRPRLYHPRAHSVQLREG